MASGLPRRKMAAAMAPAKPARREKLRNKPSRTSSSSYGRENGHPSQSRSKSAEPDFSYDLEDMTASQLILELDNSRKKRTRINDALRQILARVKG